MRRLLLQAAKAMLAHDSGGSQVAALSTIHGAGSRPGHGGRSRDMESKQPLLERATAAVAESPRFVLLDFRRVHGLDATAARTIGTLASTLATMGVQLIVTQLDNPETARLLAAHGVELHEPGVAPLPPGAYRSFPTLHDGMVYCETQYLKASFSRSAPSAFAAPSTVF